jgi:hypothetical protein
MTSFDPLVDFSVASTCPACGATAELPVDLEELALSRFAVRQRALLQEVHVLASRYGWSEDDILALPPARRARYVRMIEDEGGPR